MKIDLAQLTKGPFGGHVVPGVFIIVAAIPIFCWFLLSALDHWWSFLQIKIVFSRAVVRRENVLPNFWMIFHIEILQKMIQRRIQISRLQRFVHQWWWRWGSWKIGDIQITRWSWSRSRLKNIVEEIRYKTLEEMDSSYRCGLTFWYDDIGHLSRRWDNTRGNVRRCWCC